MAEFSTDDTVRIVQSPQFIDELQGFSSKVAGATATVIAVYDDGPKPYYEVRLDDVMDPRDGKPFEIGLYESQVVAAPYAEH